MPILKPDTSNAADLSPINEGIYKGSIVAVTAKKSKEKQENMLELKCKLQVDGKEKERTTFVMLEGKGAGAFDNLLRAVHMDQLADVYKDPNVTDKPDFDTDSLLNQEVQFRIEADLYQKKDDQGNPVGSARITDKIVGFLKA